jgi:hypothetical protein
MEVRLPPSSPKLQVRVEIKAVGNRQQTANSSEQKADSSKQTAAGSQQRERAAAPQDSIGQNSGQKQRAEQQAEQQVQSSRQTAAGRTASAEHQWAEQQQT